jgi:hypothetical protein
MLRFPYQDEPLTGPAPPSLPAAAIVRWRPLIPMTIIGPGGLVRDFGRAVLDPASDDTVFPLDTIRRISAHLRPDTAFAGAASYIHSGLGMSNLLLTDNGSSWRWPAVVGFSPAPLRYPILGQSACLQFIDARFLGANLLVELETNHTYHGTQT